MFSVLSFGFCLLFFPCDDLVSSFVCVLELSRKLFLLFGQKLFSDTFCQFLSYSSLGCFFLFLLSEFFLICQSLGISYLFCFRCLLLLGNPFLFGFFLSFFSFSLLLCFFVWHCSKASSSEVCVLNQLLHVLVSLFTFGFFFCSSSLLFLSLLLLQNFGLVLNLSWSSIQPWRQIV